MANDVDTHSDPARPTSVSAERTSLLPFRSKVAYGLGDLASQLAWTLGTSYLALFYTDSVGLAVGAVAALMLVARILDAVIDPVIGGLSERTRSKHGRFRPWILYGAPLLALLMVLTFTAPFGNGVGGFLWATGTYILLGLLYSAVNVPYGSLAVVMSPSSADRVTLNSFRLVGANVGGVVLALVSAPLIVHISGVGDGETMLIKGYTITAAIMAVLSVALFYVVFANTREVVEPVSHERVTAKQTISVVLGNKPLMCLFAAQLLVMLAFFGRMGTVLYYYIHDVQRFDLISILMMVPSLAGVVGIVAFARPSLALRFGKRNLAMTANAVSAASLLALYLVGYHNVSAVVVLSFVYGVANFGIAVMMSMIPDTIDDAEIRTGIRSDGTGYAAVSFSQKVGTALGSAIALGLLGVFGYNASAHEQSAGALNGINLVVNVLPAICYLITLIPLHFYSISEERNAANHAELAVRRAESQPRG